MFIECLPESVKEYPALFWCVIGSGSEEHPFRDKAKKKMSAITYDNEEELVSWFMRSQVLVHSGSIGLSVLQAMGYGLPVVTYGYMAMLRPEIATLEDGVNGVLYKTGSREGLIRRVSMLPDKPAMPDELSSSALITARTEYNTKIMASSFIRLNNKRPTSLYQRGARHCQLPRGCTDAAQ